MMARPVRRASRGLAPPPETGLRLDGETREAGRSRQPRRALWCDGRSGGARPTAPTRRSRRLLRARCRLRKVRAAGWPEGTVGSRREARPEKGGRKTAIPPRARRSATPPCLPRPRGSGTVLPAGGCGAGRHHRGGEGKGVWGGARGRAGEGLSRPAFPPSSRRPWGARPGGGGRGVASGASALRDHPRPRPAAERWRFPSPVPALGAPGSGVAVRARWPVQAGTPPLLLGTHPAGAAGVPETAAGAGGSVGVCATAPEPRPSRGRSPRASQVGANPWGRRRPPPGRLPPRRASQRAPPALGRRLGGDGDGNGENPGSRRVPRSMCEAGCEAPAAPAAPGGRPVVLRVPGLASGLPLKRAPAEWLQEMRGGPAFVSWGFWPVWSLLLEIVSCEWGLLKPGREALGKKQQLPSALLVFFSEAGRSSDLAAEAYGRPSHAFLLPPVRH